jgi:uncharacterized protein (DUF2252 family)
MDTNLSHVTDLASTDERRAAGHELRGRLPRSAHAAWPADGLSRDPVAQIVAADTGKIRALLPLRYARMRADPFAFLRGTAALMAADLATQPATTLIVQACGDAHLLNFGSYLSAEGLPVFDINDFDETLPAPFEWDLKRLAASLVVSARVQDQGQKPARALARRAAHAYRQHIDVLASLAPLDAWRSRIDLDRAIEEIGDRDVRRRERHRLAQAQEATRNAFRHLATATGRLHLPEKPPSVYRLPDHEPVAHAAFAAYRGSLAEERRVLLERYRLRDVAFKAVGVGSVGTFCALGLFTTADDDILILQLKEARTSVLAAHRPASAYADQGQRVVTGQRMMQASTDVFLGWAEQHPGGQHFYVRQLKDARMAAMGTAISADALRFYAQLCGRTLARAHARSGDAAQIAGYLGEGDTFDEAIAEFAWRYSEQTIADHAAFVAALGDGRIEAARE